MYWNIYKDIYNGICIDVQTSPRTVLSLVLEKLYEIELALFADDFTTSNVDFTAKENII